MGQSHTRIRVYMELSNSPMPAWTVPYVKMRCFALYPDSLDNIASYITIVYVAVAISITDAIRLYIATAIDILIQLYSY